MSTGAIIMLVIGAVLVYGALTAAIVNYIRADRGEQG